MYKLLVVDDEERERTGITGLLRHFGFAFEAKQARNGEEALEKIKLENFDVLLTDIKMPYMNGIELIEKIHEIGRYMICIIYSAYGEFEYAQRAINLGVSRYILKPLSIDNFQKVFSEVEFLCDEHNQQKEKHEKYSEYHEIKQPLFDRQYISRIVKIAIKIISEKYAEQGMGLSFLSDSLSVSPSYLSALFKAETGKNFVKYITELRIEKAKELLNKTNFRIIDIGIKVGYFNESYFIKKFHEREGMSPSQYREKKYS
jgi:two-component system response regulator YesN